MLLEQMHTLVVQALASYTVALQLWPAVATLGAGHRLHKTVTLRRHCISWWRPVHARASAGVARCIGERDLSQG